MIEENPASGNDYATEGWIFSVAFYLFFVTAGTIYGLHYWWPSCETPEHLSQNASELKINYLSPSYGSIQGGELTSLWGAGFVDGVAVSFGGTLASEVGIVDSTHLRVITPPHGKGVVYIKVTNPGQKSRELSPGFLYQAPEDPAPKPKILSVSPLSGPLDGGQQVTIKGSGLKNVTMVSFGGHPGIIDGAINDTTLLVTTPPHNEGKVDVAIEAGATTEIPEAYTYTCWSEVSSHLFILVVFSGALGGSLHGIRSLVWHVGKRDLQNSWLLKYFFFPVSGAAIAVIFFLAVLAGFYSPQGSSNLIVIGLAGLVGMFSEQAAEKLKKIAEGLLSEVPKTETSDSSKPMLKVTALYPKTGSANGKTKVTITGEGFDKVAIVCFGEHDGSVNNSGQGCITVTTPPHAAGKVDVTVINENGQSFTVRGGYEYIA
jgi:large repetitive protein